MVLIPNKCNCCSTNECSLDSDTNINIFKLKISDFLKNIEKKLNVKYSDVEKIKLILKIMEKRSHKSCQCHAIVQNLDGRTYQCTRKKKFGNFCGLHHNRKNSFKTIESRENFEDYQFFLDLYSLRSNKIDNNVNKNELHQITYNLNTYLLNSINGNVYIDDPDDFSDNSSIDNYNSLNDDDKKRFTENLIFIGNINELNMPFKIL